LKVLTLLTDVVLITFSCTILKSRPSNVDLAERYHHLTHSSRTNLDKTMPVRAGAIMATMPGQTGIMISDGKRMRLLWVEGDGDGNSSPHVVQRCQATMKGHPTWKIFCSDVPNPIVRGQDEPPYYVYLDDLACHTVWRSQLYTKSELRAFWPFDFDHVGKIKTGRPNRGRPAYKDDSLREYDTTILRNKGQVYVFRGAPDFEDEAGVKAEPSVEKDAAPPGDNSAPSEPLTPTILPIINPIPPRGGLVPNTSDFYPSRPNWQLGNGRIPFEQHTSKAYVSGPTDGSLKPLGMAHKAVQGSPYFDIPAAAFRSRPRARGGDLAGSLGEVVGKRKRSERVRNMVEEEEETAPAKKRCDAQSSEDSLGIASKQPVKVEADEEVQLASTTTLD
jgi:hypothetical protein